MPGPTWAENEAAEEAFRDGIAAFQEKNYAGAVAAFKKADELSPASKKVLFAWAQASRLGGDCMSAVVLYNRLLRLAPSAKQTEVVSQALAECEETLSPEDQADIRRRLKELDMRPPREAKTNDTPSETKPKVIEKKELNVPVVVEGKPQSQGISRAPAYWLMGAGLVSTAVGVTFYSLAKSANSSSADTFQERLDAAKLADDRRLISTITLAGGGALVAAGVVWFFVARSAEEEEIPVTSWLTRESVGFAVSGRF